MCRGGHYFRGVCSCENIAFLQRSGSEISAVETFLDLSAVLLERWHNLEILLNTAQLAFLKFGWWMWWRSLRVVVRYGEKTPKEIPEFFIKTLNSDQRVGQSSLGHSHVFKKLTCYVWGIFLFFFCFSPPNGAVSCFPRFITRFEPLWFLFSNSPAVLL